MPDAKRALAPKPSSGNGLNLPGERLAKRVSLEEIAAKTKISLRFLQAIEAEDFAQLPGGIFTTSYLRQYAEAIGIAPEPLLNQYDNAMNPPAVPLEAKGAMPVNSRGILGRWFRVPARSA